MLTITLILVIVLVLLAIASLLPFTLHVNLTKSKESISYHVVFHWPWRILGFGMRKDMQGQYAQLLCKDKCLYEREKRKKVIKEKKKKNKNRFNIFGERELIIQLAKVTLNFFRDLFLCFRHFSLSGGIEIGFSDPAATGIMSGLLYAISPKGVLLDKLKVNPNYVDSMLLGMIDFRTDVKPIRVLVVFIKLLFHLPIIELLRLRRKLKRKSEEKEIK